MKIYLILILQAITAMILTASSPNLVPNGGFETIISSTGMPEGWKTFSPREEISPLFAADNSLSHSGRFSARITSKGNPGTFGYWSITIPGVNSGIGIGSPLTAQTIPGSDFLGNRHYKAECWFRTSGNVSPERNIRINITWLDKSGKEIFTEIISRYRKEGEWCHAEQVLTAPRNSDRIKVDLRMQWTGEGSAWWDDLSISASPAPAERKVKVAAASSQPDRPATTEKNLGFYASMIGEAGKAGIDLLCLGEGITIVGTGKNFEQVSETVPGPSSRLLGEAARKAHMYVVAGIYEREGSLIYNTALLIDRQGNIAGKYRKTHLPQTEVEGGLTPGDSYPVFETDFGNVGIEICYDNFFPEVARSLAVNGAEIILLPIWGDRRGDYYAWDITAKSRAIDNCAFMVTSMYNNPDACLIIDRDGRTVKGDGRVKGIVSAEIDLGRRTFERWLSVSSYGEWKSLMPAERRGGTYPGLTSYGLEVIGNK